MSIQLAKYDALQKMTDEDLAKNYDLALAVEVGNSSFGANARYFLDEIVRRKNDKQTQTLLKVAWLTLIATVAALAVAVIALFHDPSNPTSSIPTNIQTIEKHR